MKYVKWVLCLALILPATITAQAQDPTRIDLLRKYTEVLFPSAVNFHLAFTFSPDMRLDRIERVRIAYELPNRRIVDAYPDTVADITVEEWGFSVNYLFAPDSLADLPPPMSNTPYTWTVALDDGSTATFEGEILFEDERFEWETASTEWIVLHIYTPTINVPLLEQQMAPVNERLIADTGRPLFHQFAIYAVTDTLCAADRLEPTPTVTPLIEYDITPIAPPREPSPTPAGAAVPYCDAVDIEQVYRDAGIIPIKQRNLNQFDLQNDMAHAMAEEVWREVWGADIAKVPAWFAEALPALYELAPHGGALAVAEDVLGQGDGLPLDAMQTVPADLSPSTLTIDPWYAQSVSMLLYLVDRYDPGVPGRIARAIPQADTFEAAVIAETGEGMSAHLDAWRAWVRGGEAEAMSVWTFYLIPTATPTATHTPSITWTPSATFTPSNTPFPTQFGVEVQTPRPPAYPTRTPTQRPPTNTPRPPRTATPTQRPPDQLGSGGSGVLLAVLAMVGIPAVLAVIVVSYILIGRRRRRRDE